MQLFYSNDLRFTDRFSHLDACLFVLHISMLLQTLLTNTVQYFKHRKTESSRYRIAKSLLPWIFKGSFWRLHNFSFAISFPIRSIFRVRFVTFLPPYTVGQRRLLFFYLIRHFVSHTKPSSTTRLSLTFDSSFFLQYHIKKIWTLSYSCCFIRLYLVSNVHFYIYPLRSPTFHTLKF